MNLLGLVASPRQGSNTDILVDTILERAQEAGHRADKVYLYDHDIGPCIDCRGCKKADLACIVQDGMQELYPRLDAADAFVIGTPVYWYGPTATLKLLVDRLRPYYGNGGLEGKRAVIAAPAGDGPGDADLLVEMLRRTCSALGIDLVGAVLGTAYERREILEDTKAMEEARALGALL